MHGQSLKDGILSEWHNSKPLLVVFTLAEYNGRNSKPLYKGKVISNVTIVCNRRSTEIHCFALSMGGIVGAGYGFRLLAQQASKILNVFWAGSGSAVSASIAALGTSAIGKAAIAYYIDDKTIEEAKSTFEASRKED